MQLEHTQTHTYSNYFNFVSSNTVFVQFLLLPHYYFKKDHVLFLAILELKKIKFGEKL